MADDEFRSWLEQADRTDEIAEGPSAWWDDERNRGGRRRWTLWVLAALPWVVLAGLALAGKARPAEPPAGPVVAPPRLAPPATASPAPTVAQPASAAPATAALAPADPAVAAIAAIAVQTVITGTDPASGRDRYVDLAVAEGVTWLGDVALVRVAAVVFEGGQGYWDAPRLAAYAVPMRVASGAPAPVSPPWALPDPPKTALSPTGFVPIDDPELVSSAGRALEAAGYAGVVVSTVARDPVLPGILQAEVTATAPGEAAARGHTVWLRDDPAPALLGTRASITAPPAADPSLAAPQPSAKPKARPRRAAPRNHVGTPPATATAVPETATGAPSGSWGSGPRCCRRIGATP
jgi:hypothetical protein